MDVAAAVERPTRRPRFRRASEPPAFRLTDDDVEIVRQVARFRFLRSTHIAALVNRSVDRANDRLMRLFHAGYIDRPRAQLDRFPSEGSAPLTYALGFVLATGLLHLSGILIGLVDWLPAGSKLLRTAGGLIAVTGLFLLAALVTHA